MKPIQNPIAGNEDPGDLSQPQQALAQFYRALNTHDLKALGGRAASGRSDLALGLKESSGAPSRWNGRIERMVFGQGKNDHTIWF